MVEGSHRVLDSGLRVKGGGSERLAWNVWSGSQDSTTPPQSLSRWNWNEVTLREVGEFQRFGLKLRT